MDHGAIARAVKAQLAYPALLSPEYRRVLSIEEIADLEVGRQLDHQAVLENHPSAAESSATCHRSFRLTEGRLKNRSAELAGQGVISLSEGTGAASSESSGKGKKKAIEEATLAKDTDRKAGQAASEVAVDLRRWSSTFEGRA